MKVTCAPARALGRRTSDNLQIVLYGQPDRDYRGSVGSGILERIRRLKLLPSPRASDLMSFALSVVAADKGVLRTQSPDGWTRQIELNIAVSDPDFWNAQAPLLDDMLRFLTNDLWTCTFTDSDLHLVEPATATFPDEDAVALLSGGLDSLVGAIDLTTRDQQRLYLASQISQGDSKTQDTFAARIGTGLSHLQLNHNATCPDTPERSQRSRSIVFLAFGTFAATTLSRYHAGAQVSLYVCENGFISLNPPLTTARIGSLSTRTTHPFFLRQFQRLLDAAGLTVLIQNPYQFQTKGEMLARCADQPFLRRYASTSTSCARYGWFGYRHCGRCVPCLVRRAAFHAWGVTDHTHYVYEDLSIDDEDHARFDDVRSAAMAVAQNRAEGLSAWLGTTLNSALIGDVTPYRQVADRGLRELGTFLDAQGVT